MLTCMLEVKAGAGAGAGAGADTYVCCLSGHGAWHLNALVKDVAEELLLRLAVEQDDAIHHLIHDDSERPPVDSRAVGLVADDL